MRPRSIVSSSSATISTNCFQDAMMPSLAIYYGQTIRNAAQRAVPGGDWYKRAQQQRLEPEATCITRCMPGLRTL
jgi:hypothetical protein